MAKARTPKQRAALRKAQLASARKRKRGALARNVGRGVIGSKRGSRKGRYRAARYAGGAAVAIGVAVGAAYIGKRTAQRRPKNFKYKKPAGTKTRAAPKKTTGQAAFLHKTRPRTASKGPNRHNRVFVTSKYGTTSVRKRGN